MTDIENKDNNKKLCITVIILKICIPLGVFCIILKPNWSLNTQIL